MKNFLYKLIHYQMLFVFILVGAAAAEVKTQDNRGSINMVHARESAEAMLKEGVKLFELESGYKVNLVFVHTDNLKQLLIKGALNNSLPDVILAPSDFASIAPIIKLSKLPPALLSSDLMPEAVESMHYQENYYGVPVISGNHLMLFYNKKYVQNPAKNWQELKEQAPELRARGIEPIGWNYHEMYWFSGFAATLGGSILSNGKLSLNSSAYADALVFYKELTESGLIPFACDYDCAQKDFQDQRFAYSINGEWALADFEHALGKNLGITLIPAIGDKPFRPLFSTLGLMFPDNSLEGVKAKSLSALALFFQSSGFQDRIFEQQRFLPVNKNSFKHVEAEASDNIKMLLKQLAQARPMSPNPVMASAWLGMRKGFERYMAGISSAEEAVDYMQKFAERDYQKLQSEK
ncbi:sugar ABC transporter substrate-binding protein [Psychromonas ossibalaenae]|uniref:sugar ABC transporter substrate-binding protein n=1 Tax=Psychromonas ossibalaenae TaxID=444922 RepID=UPI00036A1EB1|nr:extracellular solute-binding protein [Psychromonas ossibalaenae]